MTRIWIGAAVATAVLFGMTPAMAGEGKGRQRGRNGAKRQEMRTAVQAHMQEQRAENKAFRESQKGQDAADIAAAAQSHRSTQYSENEAFFAEQYKGLVESVKARMAERDVPAEKQSEILARLETNYNERTAHHSTQHQETMALLQELGQKADLTQEELFSTLKKHCESQRAENKAFRESRREAAKAHRQARQGACGGGGQTGE